MCCHHQKPSRIFHNLVLLSRPSLVCLSNSSLFLANPKNSKYSNYRTKFNMPICLNLGMEDRGSSSKLLAL